MFHATPDQDIKCELRGSAFYVEDAYNYVSPVLRTSWLVHYLNEHPEIHTLFIHNCLLNKTDALFISGTLYIKTLILSPKETSVTTMHNNRIGDEGAKSLAKNPTFQTLILKDNNIQWEGATALLNMPNIRELNLESNPVTHDSYGWSRQLQINNPTKLRRLDMSFEVPKAIQDTVDLNFITYQTKTATFLKILMILITKADHPKFSTIPFDLLLIVVSHLSSNIQSPESIVAVTKALHHSLQTRNWTNQPCFFSPNVEKILLAKTPAQPSNP